MEANFRLIKQILGFWRLYGQILKKHQKNGKLNTQNSKADQRFHPMVSSNQRKLLPLTNDGTRKYLIKSNFNLANVMRNSTDLELEELRLVRSARYVYIHIYMINIYRSALSSRPDRNCSGRDSVASNPCWLIWRGALNKWNSTLI